MADVTEVVEEGPRSGKEHAYTTSCHLDSSGDFDQSHPPRTSVAFTKRIRFAAAVKVAENSQLVKIHLEQGSLFFLQVLEGLRFSTTV